MTRLQIIDHPGDPWKTINTEHAYISMGFLSYRDPTDPAVWVHRPGTSFHEARIQIDGLSSVSIPDRQGGEL